MSTEEEIRSEQRAIARQTRDDAEQLQLLMAHPGWKVYLRLIEAVGQNYYVTLVAPLENVNDCVKAEYAKGTLNGLSAATSLPRTKIQEAQDLNLTRTED